jgi:HAE1 family hydrophobic/amphiphilic exporter-1
MSITEISVRRPAAITIVLALLIGLGIIGYMSMGADLLPSLNVPVITVSVTYAGAGAEEIKKDVVKPLEDAVSGISGIDKTQSSAREGYGQVMIRFTMETDMNTALMDVQKAVEGVSGSLPKDAGKPILYKMDPGDMEAIMLSVSGDVPYDQMYSEADKIGQRLKKINGIGKVVLEGGQKKELSVKIDKTALEYYGVNVNTIIAKLKSDNINIPAGQIKDEQSYQSVKIVGEYKDINEIKNIFIPTVSGGSIRLADIADVKLQYPKPDNFLRIDGKDTIGISVYKQSDANIVVAVDGVKTALEEIKNSLPKGIKLDIAMDTTVFIKTALKGIQKNLFEGIIITAVVLLLFLKSWRSSLIVLVAIPTSLISTFFMMYLSHFTLNLLSLMGLSLCIGILVDDSIVILENIQRHLDKGKNRIDAAIDGRKEIGMAAIAITLCDVVVFAPVAFMSGMAGQMFKQFGLTVAFASLFSLFVSFTITPMLASRFLKKGDIKNIEDSSEDMERREVLTKRTFGRTTAAYKRILLWCLRHRWSVIGLVVAGIIFSIALIPMGLINFELMPVSDQSMFTINMNLTPGTNLDATDKKVKIVEQYLKGIHEIKEFFSVAGNSNDSSSAMVWIMLKSKNERTKSQSQIAAEVRDWGKKLDGVDFVVSESQMGPGGGSSKPIQINITGSDTNVLTEISNKVEEIVKTVPGLTDISNSTSTRESEIRLKIDRLAAASYGVSPVDVAGVLRTAMQGANAGVYRENGDEHDIVVTFADNQVKTPQDIGTIEIMNNAGQKVLINQVASIERADSAQAISRMDRQDVVTVSANMQPGAVLGIISNELNQKVKNLSVPSGYSIDFGGNQKQMGDSFSALLKALGASLVLIYMILVVLYESFMTPLIRMLALPCALIGALGIFALTGKPIDMMTMIGLIMLDGLASKNGTLLIDYTNTLLKKGLPLKDALIEAGTTRLRPIIMTSATMIVGMLPVALSLDEGSEMKVGMALIIIGGMVTSTILTPILLPVVYSLMDDIKNSLSRKRKKKNGILEVPQYEM